MTVKVVTDSMADLPAGLIKQFDITVIPVNVLFGMETYRDGVDLTTEQFYSKLVASKILPTTAVPSLGVFSEAYEKLAKETKEILVLTISHKLSGTFETASRAVSMVKAKCRIQVVDTLQVIMGEGLIALRAAELAKAGAGLDEIVKRVQEDIQRVEERMAFDSLEYLKKGGRIGAAQAFLGSILKVNPVLGMKDGEVFPVSRERSRAKAMDTLYNFVLGFTDLEAIAVEHATTPEEADQLAERLKEKFPTVPLYRSKVGAVIGTHVGPSIVAVSVIGNRKN